MKKILLLTSLFFSAVLLPVPASTLYIEQAMSEFKSSHDSDLALDPAIIMSYAKCHMLVDNIKTTESKKEKKILKVQLKTELPILIETLEYAFSYLKNDIAELESKKNELLTAKEEKEKELQSLLSKDKDSDSGSDDYDAIEDEIEDLDFDIRCIKRDIEDDKKEYENLIDNLTPIIEKLKTLMIHTT